MEAVGVTCIICKPRAVLCGGGREHDRLCLVLLASSVPGNLRGLQLRPSQSQYELMSRDVIPVLDITVLWTS